MKIATIFHNSERGYPNFLSDNDWNKYRKLVLIRWPVISCRIYRSIGVETQLELFFRDYFINTIQIEGLSA